MASTSDSKQPAKAAAQPAAKPAAARPAAATAKPAVAAVKPATAKPAAKPAEPKQGSSGPAPREFLASGRRPASVSGSVRDGLANILGRAVVTFTLAQIEILQADSDLRDEEVMFDNAGPRAPEGRPWQSYANHTSEEPVKAVTQLVTVTTDVKITLASLLVGLADLVSATGKLPVDRPLAALGAHPYIEASIAVLLSAVPDRYHHLLREEPLSRVFDFPQTIGQKFEVLLSDRSFADPGAEAVAHAFLGLVKAIAWHAAVRAYEQEHLTLNRAALCSILAAFQAEASVGVAARDVLSYVRACLADWDAAVAEKKAAAPPKKKAAAAGEAKAAPASETKAAAAKAAAKPATKAPAAAAKPAAAAAKPAAAAAKPAAAAAKPAAAAAAKPAAAATAAKPQASIPVARPVSASATKVAAEAPPEGATDEEAEDGEDEGDGGDDGGDEGDATEIDEEESKDVRVVAAAPVKPAAPAAAKPATPAPAGAAKPAAPALAVAKPVAAAKGASLVRAAAPAAGAATRSLNYDEALLEDLDGPQT